MKNVPDLLAGEAPKVFKRPPPFYDLWQDQEGIPIYKQFHVEDMNTVELGHWERFGGKAAQLGELIAAGTRVPDGLVLTVAAGELSADERGSLLRAGVADLGSGPFAVRSSGIAEDGAERSFAGMYETVLDVSADGLSAAADRVLASAQAARAKRVSSSGQPAASSAAVLAVVDAEQPPLRIFLGEAPLGIATADYESRLATWREWQPVSVAAGGV